MAIYDADSVKKEVSILYHIAGKGTQALSELELGEAVNFFGPLGNHFPHDSKKRTWIVAGGIGIAPFRLWAKKQSFEAKNTPRSFFGFRSSAQAGVLSEFEDMPGDVVACVQHGEGFDHQGLVTEALQEHLAKDRPDQIYCCGPDPMMKAVAEICRNQNIPCYVSLEAKMACGMGVCLSCVSDFPIETTFEQSLVCKHGPVFRSK